jgi:hypothetical protein
MIGGIDVTLWPEFVVHCNANGLSTLVKIGQLSLLATNAGCLNPVIQTEVCFHLPSLTVNIWCFTFPMRQLSFTHTGPT